MDLLLTVFFESIIHFNRAPLQPLQLQRGMADLQHLKLHIWPGLSSWSLNLLFPWPQNWLGHSFLEKLSHEVSLISNKFNPNTRVWVQGQFIILFKPGLKKWEWITSKEACFGSRFFLGFGKAQVCCNSGMLTEMREQNYFYYLGPFSGPCSHPLRLPGICLAANFTWELWPSLPFSCACNSHITKW